MIKSYEEKYNKQVYNFLNGYQMNWAGQALETVLAVDGEEVIGIGSISKSELHPYREYINVYVQPEKRRNGTGTSIFSELFSLSQTKRFQAATSAKNTAAVSFLEECGFHLARKSYTPQLKKNASLLLSDRKINTKSFDELSLHQSDELLKLQLENYREFHQEINLLSDKISFNRWKEIISIDLDREHSQVFVKEGTIEAYILCYESEDINSIEIGYIGGKDANKLEEYLTFYKQALSHLFTKFKIIEIEADDVDSFAYALLNEFEYETSESWDTYIYDKNIYSQL